MHFTKSTAAALAVTLPLTFAQTFTDCDPTKRTCPNNPGLNADALESDFMGGKTPASWSHAAYSTINYGNQGAQFTISQEKQAPTIETDFFIFFGRVDVKMRAAPGVGIVSSVVFESEDLDEIDWEFVGGDTANVQSNFFGKGNTTSYDRMQMIPVSNPQDELHTYSVDWNADRINWIIDGDTVRTLTYDDPLTVGGYNYPQTPMRVKLGTWCGGCEGMPKGTVEWAGGETNFAGAPYTMYVESVTIQNYNPGNEYQWTDKTGSWESIKVITGGNPSNPTGGDGMDSDEPTTTVSDSEENPTVVPDKGHSVVDSTAAPVPTGGAHHGSANGTYTMHTATKTNEGGAPTGGAGASGLGATGTASSGPVRQTGNAAASIKAITSTTLLGMVFSLLFL